MNRVEPPAATPEWNAADYAANSAVQLRWARELFGRLSLRGDEHILDLGCGDGKVTAELARKVPRGRVVGLDASNAMIRFARKAFPSRQHPNLTFQVGDARSVELATFSKRRTPSRNAGRPAAGGHATPKAGDPFDIVFSNAALHWVDNHPAVLRGAAAVLRTGGRLVVSCGGRGNAHEVFLALRPVMRQARWRAFFRRMPMPYFFYAPSDYEQWLPRAGFKIHSLKLAPKDATYPGREGFARWLRTTWLPFTQRVPEEPGRARDPEMSLREQFIAAVAERYLAKHPQDNQDQVHVRMVRLEISAQKM